MWQRSIGTAHVQILQALVLSGGPRRLSCEPIQPTYGSRDPDRGWAFSVELVAGPRTRLSSSNCYSCSGVVLASRLQGEFAVEMQADRDKFSGAGREIVLVSGLDLCTSISRGFTTACDFLES